MNLEQIKERQESINGQLSKLVEEFTSVINFIAGDNEDKKCELNSEPKSSPNGILEKIFSDQDQTDKLISLLQSQLYKLDSKTFHQVESLPNCKMNN